MQKLEQLYQTLRAVEFPNEREKVRLRSLGQAFEELAALQAEEVAHIDGLQLVEWNDEDRQETDERRKRVERLESRIGNALADLTAETVRIEMSAVSEQFSPPSPPAVEEEELRSAVELVNESEEVEGAGLDELSIKIRQALGGLPVSCLGDIGQPPKVQVNRPWEHGEEVSKAMYAFEVLLYRWIKLRRGKKDVFEIDLAKDPAIQTLLSRSAEREEETIEA